MAATLEALRKSISTAEELQSVVKSMKGMAAASIRHFQAAVESLADYSHTVELGLQCLLTTEPDRLTTGREPGTDRLGSIVFGSDQGMCGGFNNAIADRAVEEITGSPVSADRRRQLVVGARIVPLLEAADLSIDEQVRPASSVAGIAPLVQEIIVRVDRWRREEAVSRIVVFYNKLRGGARYEPRVVQLVPVDMEWLGELRGRAWPTNQFPAHTMPWTELFQSLIREHLYSAIYRAAAESLASENASRLSSMQAAERNIEERLGQLNMAYRQQRQQSITAELLDIVSGFEALAGEDDEDDAEEDRERLT